MRTIAKTVAITAGDFVAVVGANGSGKSTLARILAGLDPTTGLVDRPGHVGLGAPGGTALVFQHPESQILGRTVAEDVRWGLDDADGTLDVDALLERVGLGGLADRPTEVIVTEAVRRGQTIVELSMAPGELGRVIGRQ